jgi:hypothetical protein
MRRKHLQHLPRQQQRVADHYLYAFQLADGAIKIGVTFNPRGRAGSVRRQFGVEVVRAVVAPVRAFRRQDAEKAALSVARKIGVQDKRCTELFHGLSFQEAANAIKQMAGRERLRIHATA